MSRWGLLAVLLGVIMVTGACFWWPSSPVSSVPSFAPQYGSTDQWLSYLDQHFARDESCRECHRQEYDAHQRSGHSRTARWMEQTDQAAELHGTHYPDPRRQQVLEFALREEGFFVGVRGTDAEPIFPVHWLIGSGTHAHTPLSIDPVSGRGVEFRWSWFAGECAWGLTPDHERFDDYREGTLETFGRPMDQQQALACLGCHATVTPPRQVRPTRQAIIANIGCERCHGPRKAHVEQARLGRPEDSPPLLTYTTPEQSIRQCAQCHRDESNTPADSKPETLARYQPYGLLKSRCYLESDKSLSCMTCHDPHDRTSTDRTRYIQTCLKCHTGPAQTPCSIEPAGDCVKCHMPAVEWVSGIKFHDHWIRRPTEINSPATRGDQSTGATP